MKNLVGYIGVTDIYEIDHTVFVPRNGREDDCILDVGYKRLRIFPNNKNYAICAIFNEKLEFIEFYIDIIKDMKLSKGDNTPYIEDLYLDIVYTNRDEIIILDEDELKEALNSNCISSIEYGIANSEKENIIRYLNNKLNVENLKLYCNNNLKKLLFKLNRKE